MTVAGQCDVSAISTGYNLSAGSLTPLRFWSRPEAGTGGKLASRSSLPVWGTAVWKVKAAGTPALVLLLALVLAVAASLVLPSPTTALGAVAPLDAWPATPQMTAASENLTGTFAVSDGINRLLVVLVCDYDSGGSSGQSFAATYGGKALTQAWVQNSSEYQSWLGYLKESDIASRSGDNVTVTIAGVHTSAVAYVASYSGVDQGAPVTDAGGVSTDSLIFPSKAGGPLNRDAGGYGIYGWSSASNRTRSSDTEDYIAGSNVGNMAGFSYGVASKAFTGGGSTDPLVTWSGLAGKVAVSFITLKPDSTHPVPATTGISPATKTVGDASFTLTVNGANFVSGASVVRLDGADRATTFVSSRQLTAVIPAADLAAIGDRSIAVFTPGPGGGTSNAQTLVVRLTPIVTWANPAAIVYGTALSSTQLCATASIPGTFAYAPDLGAMLPAGNSQTLHVDFTPDDTANYNHVAADALIDVVPRTIIVTAHATSKVYGAADPALAYTWSPALVGGDGFSGGLSRTAGEDVGSFAITQGTLSLPSNYALTYAGASLTVTPKVLTITANDVSKEYRTTANFTGTEFTADGLAPGDSVAAVTLTSAGAAADATIDRGPYPIVPGAAVGTHLGNYQIVYVNGSLTVTRASAALVLTSPVAESARGRPLTFTVSISATGATGTVTFMDGAAVLGSVALTEGTATFETSALDPGTHSITAAYSGDSHFAAGTSAALDITVNAVASAGLPWALIGGLAAGAALLLLLLVLARRRREKRGEAAAGLAAASAPGSQVALATAEETGTYGIQLERELESAVAKVQKSMEAGIQAVCRTVETKDPYVAAHQQRVSHLACTIAKEMGLPEWQIDGIRVAGLLHDIGKITVPTEILSKPGKLSDLETAMIRDHPRVAYDILKSIDFDWPVARIVIQHHERMDGSGYPYGISGDDILLEARILAVADVVEAMSSSRPYRAALGVEKALEELDRGKGTIYDPDVVRACESVINSRGFKVELSSSQSP